MAIQSHLYIPLEEIVVSDGRRPIDADAVKKLAKSIRQIGLQHPITVRSVKGQWLLIAGRHRLEAVRSLGERHIAAATVQMDTIDAEMWEISENLHRSDLTVLQRDTQVSRWVELQELKKAAQIAPPGGRQPAESGIRAASRDLGIERTDVQRAVKVASLSEEAKASAIEVGLDNNRTALLEASRQTTVADQVAALQARANAVKPAPDPLNDIESAERQLAALMSAWNRATGEVREEFLLRIDRPVMDRRFG